MMANARCGDVAESIIIYFTGVVTTGYVINYIPQHTIIFDDGSQGIKINLELIDE